MVNTAHTLSVAMVLASVIVAAPELSAATAAPTPSPIAGMHSLLGTWKCTYNAGTTRLPYVATYAYDRDGNILRQIASFSGGGDEELIAYDAQHHGWKAVVFDDQGDTTVMRASGSNPNHYMFRSVYPDASVAVTFDRTSPATYSLHGTVRMAGKTITSVDSCARAAR